MKRPQPDNLQSILPVNEKKKVILNFKKISTQSASIAGLSVSLQYFSGVGYLCHPVLMNLPSDKCHVRREHHIVYGDAGYIFNPR